MKYFSQEKFNGRINFVDENNLVLGYDFDASCCENFGWKLLDKDRNLLLHGKEDEEPSEDEINKIIEGFNFDKHFFVLSNSEDGYEENNHVVFRMTKENEELFLELYNYHNGYYGHGFEFLEKTDNAVIKKGVI